MDGISTADVFPNANVDMGQIEMVKHHEHKEFIISSNKDKAVVNVHNGVQAQVHVQVQHQNFIENNQNMNANVVRPGVHFEDSKITENQSG